MHTPCDLIECDQTESAPYYIRAVDEFPETGPPRNC